jgi:tetratricopeptide (TPR) repeat protein
MRAPRTSAVAAVAAALIASVVIAGYALAPHRSPVGAPAQTGADAAVLDPAGAAAPTTPAETERLIRFYENRSRTVHDAGELTFLAQLYLQRGRVTGDVTTYNQARAALAKALAMAPKDQSARTLLASTQATEHDFAAALATSRLVLATNPTDPAALAVAGDAELETGQYPQARASYTELARLSPGSAAVLVRQARIAWLSGDVATARTLAARATAAATAAGSFGAGLAFYPAFAGQLELEQGHYPQAATLYEQALVAAPGWHVALAGLGRAEAAQGRTDRAVALLRQAVDVVPQPDYLAALGDVIAAGGDRPGAQRQYDLVAFTGRLAAINRQLFNRQLVLFDADHGVHTAQAVALARAELATRHDVYGWDALGWALLADGQLPQARAAADHALALGSPDPRILYHAGMIAAAADDPVRARDLLGRALAISPQFDPVQVPRARTALAALPQPGQVRP